MVRRGKRFTTGCVLACTLFWLTSIYSVNVRGPTLKCSPCNQAGSKNVHYSVSYILFWGRAGPERLYLNTRKMVCLALFPNKKIWCICTISEQLQRNEFLREKWYGSTDRFGRQSIVPKLNRSVGPKPIRGWGTGHPFESSISLHNYLTRL